MKPVNGKFGDVRMTATLDADSERTLHAALTAIRSARRAGAEQPYTVRLRGGEYRLKEPLRIGKGLDRVTIEPYGREEVSIIGGRKLTGFAPDRFNGIDCLSLHIPEAEGGKWVFTDLYVGGKAAERCPYPKDHNYGKALKILDCEPAGTGLNDASKWVAVDPEQLRASGIRKEDLELGATVNFCHLWMDEHSPIEDIDFETGRITLSLRARYRTHPAKNERDELEELWFENIPGAFGAPGDFYLDRAEGMLYYVPRDESEWDSGLAAYAPELTTLVSITGSTRGAVENFRLRGLRFSVTRGDYSCPWENPKYAASPQSLVDSPAAVELRGARGCVISECEFTNIGLYSVRIDRGCEGDRVEDCYIHDNGGGGVILDGADVGEPEDQTVKYCTVRRCEMLRLGRRYHCSCGILSKHAFGCEFTDNEITDLYYSGISCGWVWGYRASRSRDNLIENNRISHLGQRMLSDLGGVYLLGAQPGTVVRANEIFDVTCRSYGAWCLYTDEGSGMVLLEDNVCYDVAENCFHQHYGKMNTIRNNVFAQSRANAVRITRYEGHVSFFYENNIISAPGQNVVRMNEKHYTESGVGCAENLLWTGSGSEPQYTVYVDGEGDVSKPLSWVRENGKENGSIVADPKFVDEKNGDFSLEDDSPAYDLGFRPLSL